nr:ribonuclease H-like domain-containing protein [Tanacetum cinerariifolium]
MKPHWSMAKDKKSRAVIDGLGFGVDAAKDFKENMLRLESVEARLLVYQQNETVFEEDIKLLKLEVQLRDNALVVLRQNLEKAEYKRDDLKLKLEKFQTSSKNLSQLLARQTNDKTGLGYNSFYSYQSGDGYHVVSPPYTGTFIPPKPDLVFHTTPNVNATVHTAFNVELSLTKPDNDLHVALPAVLTKSKLVPITTVRPVNAVAPNHHVTRPILTKSIVTKSHSPPRRHNNCSPSPRANNFPLKVTTVKAPMFNDVKGGNPQHALMDKEVIDSGCSRHMTGNMSSLSDFEELNGGYVAFGGNPKGGNQSNPIAGVQEQFDAEKTGEENVQQYVLFPVWSSGSTNPQNTDGNAVFEVKVLDFKGRKPQFEVYVSPSSSTQSQKHDDKTKREAKGKSHIESSTGYRNLSAKFEDFSDNSINVDNVVRSLVLAVGQITSNSTNTFSDAGPSNTVVSPTHRKSSYMDSSQLPDDPNMPELEDITYFDDEEDVGVEADFTNLKTTITVSPIPTTRVHKDHHVIQIIGDLSSAT